MAPDCHLVIDDPLGVIRVGEREVRVRAHRVRRVAHHEERAMSA